MFETWNSRKKTATVGEVQPDECGRPLFESAGSVQAGGSFSLVDVTTRTMETVEK